MRLVWALGSWLVLACLSLADDVSPARLLVAKRLLNNMLVEGKDLLVQYGLYNVGGQAGLDVRLIDLGFPPDDFEHVVGEHSVRFTAWMWPSTLKAAFSGGNVTYNVVVRPRSYGYYNFTAAQVTYLPTEESTQIQVGYSSHPGQYGILSSKDYERRYSPHVMDWGAFALMCIPTLAIPYLLFYKSASKYQALMKHSKRQ
ncbi:unnamed protein product [Darwinula stevensoni]|uniref:TRAP-beta n=1 Tax=Darwinula stevensoni TaxID=69355 RepID=A0A7R9AEM2_9CRUS|nr:unnamed protein product [Darwinula stevensoni]CAG0901545.1 unnamed protein product [Darwinula stevensoni]